MFTLGSQKIPENVKNMQIECQRYPTMPKIHQQFVYDRFCTLAKLATDQVVQGFYYTRAYCGSTRGCQQRTKGIMDIWSKYPIKQNSANTWQVFKPEFLKAAIMQSHDCANFLKTCANFGIMNRKKEKLALISYICHNLTKLFSLLISR